MKIVSTLSIILILVFSTHFLAAEDWEWTLAAKPDIDAGIFAISMLSDGKTGWGVGNDLKTGRMFHTKDGWRTWVEQTDTTLATVKLRSVSFINESIGWIVGDQGLILFTKNGGRNWIVQGSDLTKNNLVQVSAVDEKTAFACGDGGTIVFTNDGTKWSLATTGTTNPFYGMDMYDATHGIAVGKAETIVFTTDGKNWNAATTVPKIGGKDFNAVSMIDENNAWLVGDGFTVLGLKSVFARTSDGGNTWKLWESPELIFENLWAIKLNSAGKGVAVGDKGWVFLTTDGKSWTPLPRHFGNKNDAVAMVDDQIWATGSNGTIHYSKNFGENWTLLPQVIGQNLYKIGVADNNRAIGVGYASSMIKTEDGGLTWRSGFIVANNRTELQLWGIGFATSDVGWVAGFGGFIAKTTDGGDSWVLQEQSVTSDWLRHIWVLDEKTLWIVGGKGAIIKTEDGGSKWTLQGAGVATSDLKGIDGLDRNRLVAVGDKSTFLYTTDGGQTWEKAKHDLVGDKGINGVFMIDDSHAWAVGATGVLLFSSDAGKTWKNQRSPATVALDGVRFKDAKTGWIVGDKGNIFETTDGGTNWTRIDSTLTNQYLKSIDLTADGKVFAAGYNSHIVRFGPIAPSAVQVENVATIPQQYYLGQNYPNPFNPSTRIDFAVPKMSRVSIAIYNLMGQRVATLVDEQKSPGVYQISWNAANFPGGIYFVKMNANEFSSIKKILLVK